MNWKYDNIMQESQLLDGGSKLARILIIPRQKGGVIVKSLVSFIYYGTRRQEKMEKQKKEWVARKRKFKERKDAQKYVEIKKEEIQRFILAREKELE